MQSLKDLLKYNSIIFDCDGVILQSNQLKTQAFRKALSNEPIELVKKFIDYHKQNGGISRYLKFKYFYNEIKNESYSDQEINLAIDKYSKLVREELLLVEYVPGFLSVINFLNKHKIKCFVISGGDQLELNNIFKKRNIYKKFFRILGSPVSKKQHLKNLILNSEIQRPIIFFGDSQSDLDASIKYQLDFCFVSQFSEWEEGNNYVSRFSLKTIHNFEDYN